MTGTLTLPAPHAPAQLGGPQRLLPAGGAVPLDLNAHVARYGALRYAGGPQQIIAEVKAAGLTGRGGGAFPVWRKLAAAADCRPTPVVAGNGAEGEPASSKDRSLLWIAPHLVLDGLQVAAAVAGARTAVLYVRRDLRLHQRLAQAVAERAGAGMDAATVGLREAPHRFLAGEESALASRLTGRPAMPVYRPARGLPRMGSGQPVLVQNVESLAHLALIARYGAAWFRAAGTADEPGTMLTTLHFADGRASVAEVPLGIPVAGLLGLARDAAGDGVLDSSGGPVRAVLVGGYHGAWLPAGQAAGLLLANAALRPLGAATGAGVVAALPADRCGLAESARVARYLALESAGQCGPCFNGLPQIAAVLGHLAGPRPDRRARADLDRWAGLVEGRGACHHPDGSVRFVRSALRVFAGEAGLHEQGMCTGTNPRPFLPLPDDPPRDNADWS